MMKTPEQLKGAIRSMATKKNLRAQEVKDSTKQNDYFILCIV